MPSTQGIACTSVIACDCASPDRRCSLSAGGGGPETKGPATTAREFARYCREQGMVCGVQWALDPGPDVTRLMQRAFPHAQSPIAHLRHEARAELERIADVGGDNEAPTVDPEGGQDGFSGGQPSVGAVDRAPVGSGGGSEEPFDKEDWAENHPPWMDGGVVY
jgi:hypothetical protein